MEKSSEFNVYVTNASIDNIDGIGRVYAQELRRNEIETILDLAGEDVEILAKKVKIPKFKFFEFKRKAELASSIKVDSTAFRSLLEELLEDIVLSSTEMLVKKTEQSADSVRALKRDIGTLLVALDNRVARKLLLKEFVKPEQTIVQIPFETIVKDFKSGYRTPDYLVIKNRDEWVDLWNRLFLTRSPRPSLPEVDFSKSTVIAAFMGMFAKGGYEIEIKEITDHGSFVSVTVEKVDYGEPRTQAFTEPCHIVKTTKIEKSITFYTVERKVNRRRL